MCFTYDDVAEVYNETDRRARKTHRCGECRRPISCGELYVDTFAVCYGDGVASKFCGACELLRQRIHENELAVGCAWGESWYPIGDGEMQDYAREAHPPIDVPTPEEGQAFLAERRRETKSKKIA